MVRAHGYEHLFFRPAVMMMQMPDAAQTQIANVVKSVTTQPA